MNKMREELVEEFLKSLHEEQLPWDRPWMGMRPVNAVSGKNYRGVNALALSLRQAEFRYQDCRWCTYQQAKEAGWSVRKGEKGTKVEFWSLYDTVTKKTIRPDEAKKLADELTPEAYRERIHPVAKVYTVFNGEQIAGIPDLTLPGTPLPEELLAHRDTLLTAMQVTLVEEPGGSRSYYSLTSDEIHLPAPEQFKTPEFYCSVFLHEAGHATGHPSRLSRPFGAYYGSPEYAKEELRAEIASAFTAQAIGLGAQDAALVENHKAYIQGWIQVLENNPEELFAAIKDAEKISDYLIEKGEFRVRTLEDAKIAPEFNDRQMQEARIGYSQGLNAEQVGIFYKPEFTWQQMDEAREGFAGGLNAEQVAVYYKTKFTWEQMQEARLGFFHDLSTEQVGIFYMPEFTVQQMEVAREGLEEGLSTEQVAFYCKPEFTSAQMDEARKGFKYGLSAEQVGIFYKPEFKWQQMLDARLGFCHDLSAEQVAFYCKPEFTSAQMDEAQEGFKNGLSVEQVATYYKPDFTWEQMREARKGFCHDLSAEQVAFYCKPEFTSAQMDEARKGFKNGLSVEQVATYYKPDFTSAQMREARKGFEHDLSVQELSQKLEPDISSPSVERKKPRTSRTKGGR